MFTYLIVENKNSEPMTSNTTLLQRADNKTTIETSKEKRSGIELAATD